MTSPAAWRLASSITATSAESHIDPPKKQEHLIFPVLDIDLGPRWEFNLGIGAGLTPATDRLIIKAILGYRFGPMPAPEPPR